MSVTIEQEVVLMGVRERLLQRCGGTTGGPPRWRKEDGAVIYTFVIEIPASFYSESEK